MIVLLDTNVILSAAFRDGLPERVVLYVATRDDCQRVVTAEILEEYRHVLSRPKFDLSPESQRKCWPGGITKFAAGGAAAARG